ncbi:MAG: TIGR00725 family protein [Nitrospirae bacterium]|nr:TIGR00725 family protein [Nitrospirota bacterium]
MTTLIGVIGGREVEEELIEIAYEVGREIARRGAIMVCGGLGGVMEAASRGVYEEGGIAVGILPSDRKEDANPYIKIPVATGLGIGRNVIIARTADALVAVGGGYGTLSEIAFALQLGKPVIGISTWDIRGIYFSSNAKDSVEKALKLVGHKC